MNKNDAYEDLKLQIIKGRLAPGQWLVERELSGSYGISRTPVREVLFRLVSDGFLIHEPSRGFSVRVLTLEQVVGLFQAREGVEGFAARLACERLTPDGVDFLKDLRATLEKLDVKSDAQSGVALGRRLHAFIRDTARNDLLTEFYRKLNNLASLTVNMTLRVPKIEVESKQAHLDIIDALLSGDQDAAQKAMCEHLQHTSRLITRQFFTGAIFGE